MSTTSPARALRDPVRVDAALQQVVDLLELVRQEEAVMCRLARCVGELEAIRESRQALLDVTGAEIVEGRALLAQREDAATLRVGRSGGPRL